MTIQEKVAHDGFIVINDVYTNQEVDNILDDISKTDSSTPSFRRTNDLFAIRQLFKEIPSIAYFAFNEKLIGIITKEFGNEFFVVKSIYFDKPEASNWFVFYHQDLTVSVNKKMDIDGFECWTKKQNQYAVQPPLSILQDNITIRIHLDTTTEENGALKVIPGSHLKGIYRPETIDWNEEKEVNCCVEKGGVMIMKPLLLHASGRTTNGNKRRVIHIEFSRSKLPGSLRWSEYRQVPETLEYSDDFKRQLDEDYEAYLKGEMKTFTWEEVKEKTQRMLTNK